jgi:two-component system, cell cycle response regulator
LGIRGQLTLLIPGLVAVGMVSLAFLAAEQQRRDEQFDMRLRNQQVLESIGVTAAVYVAQNDMSGLDTLVAHVFESTRGGELEQLTVVDEQGRVLADSIPERFNILEHGEFAKIAISADEPVWERKADKLHIGVPAKSGLRWATVIARYSLAQVNAQVERTRAQWLGFALGLFGVIAAILYVGVDRLVVRPIRSLQTAVRKMGEGSLNTRAPPLKGREMAELSEMMNRMAGSLQSERDNLEKAVADRTRELQEANARLERLAVTDGLTGVYNHRRFQEGLASELLRSARTGRPCSVLMADVDLFKKVNDSMGHPAGDELLRRLAQVLNSALRGTDLLARYGGEEFAALLPETSKTVAGQVAERMRSAVETELNGDARWTQRITISIGVATYPDDGKTGEQALEAADQALYVAKHQGRNRVVISRAAA